MTMQERKELARKTWGARDGLWRLGISTEALAAAFGYKDKKTLAVHLVRIRKQYPGLFAAREKGFVPLEQRLRKIGKSLRDCAGLFDSLALVG